MSIQKLEYKHRDVIAVDGVGNLVTDSAGNLCNVIPPVIISPGASFGTDTNAQGKSCWYGSIEYGGKTYDWSGCSDNGESNPVRIETEGFLLRFTHRGADSFAAVTNLRNLAKVHDSLTVKVYAGNNFVPVTKKVSETEEFITYSNEHAATYHGIKVLWGEQSIGDQGYHCPGGNYYVGSVTINFSDLTVTLNTDDVTWYSGPFKCGEIWDEPIDPDVTIITVYATHEWCSPESDVQAYTEVSQVVEGSRVWRNYTNRVIVPEGVDEDSAKNAAAWTNAVSLDTRDYIIGADGTVYWEDTDYVPSSVREISVRLMEDHLTGKKLWAMGYGYPGETDCRYRATTIIDKASEKRLSSLSEQRNFPAPGNVVADSACNIAALSYHIVDNRRGVVLVSDEISCSLETIACGEGHEYLKFSGSRGGVSFECRTRIFSGSWLSGYVGGCGGLAEYLRVNGWLPVASLGGWSCITDELGMQYIDDTSPEIGEIRGSGFSNSVFSIDGGLYTVPYSATEGYVYEFVRRWITSPCDAETEQAVYTGSTSGKYYASAEEAQADVNGVDITSQGTNVFSFVGNNELTYYRVGIPAIDETITDEEFE